MFKLDLDILFERYQVQLDWFKRTQRYIYLGVVVSVLGYLILTVSWPSIRVVADKREELKAYAERLKTKKEDVLDKEKVELELKRLQASLTELQGQFFTEEDINEFSLNILSKIAGNYQNKIITIRYKESQAIGNGIMEYPVEVVMEGQYINIMKMFNELESFEKEIKIESFSFKRKSVAPLILSVNLVINAYAIVP